MSQILKSWGDLTATEKAHLADLLEAGSPLPYRDFKMKDASLRRKVSEFAQNRREVLVAQASAIRIVEPPRRKWTDYLTLDGDDWLIISDIEVPDHDVVYLRLALLTAMARGIKKCVIAGDLVATDQQALNSWVNTWSPENQLNYLQAVGVTNTILDEYARWFDEIYIIEGNHDDRIARATKGELYLGAILKNNSRVYYSRYAYLYLRTSARGLIKVVHPSNFSQDPVTLGEKLYNVEQGPNYNPYNPIGTFEKSHIVLAHCHRKQTGKSPDGVYEIHALGTGRDEQATQYKSKSATKHYQWDHAFLAVKDGFFYPYDVATTNWRAELGALYPGDMLEDAKEAA